VEGRTRAQDQKVRAVANAGGGCSSMSDDKSSTRHRDGATRIAWAMVGVSLVALAFGLAYAYSEIRARDTRLTELETLVSQLSVDQQLLAAVVQAGEDTSTVAVRSSEPATDSASSTMKGAGQPVFARIRKAAKAPYGWELTVDPAQYITGAAGFSVASSKGELTNEDGSFILDTSARTVKLKLLKKATVTVGDAQGSPDGDVRELSASELVAALPGGRTEDRVLSDAWFWMEVRDGYVLRAVQQHID